MTLTINDIEAALHLASGMLRGYEHDFGVYKDKHGTTLDERDLHRLADAFVSFGQYVRGDFDDLPVFGAPKSP